MIVTRAGRRRAEDGLVVVKGGLQQALALVQTGSSRVSPCTRAVGVSLLSRVATPAGVAVPGIPLSNRFCGGLTSSRRAG